MLTWPMLLQLPPVVEWKSTSPWYDGYVVDGLATGKKLRA